MMVLNSRLTVQIKSHTAPLACLTSPFDWFISYHGCCPPAPASPCELTLVLFSCSHLPREAAAASCVTTAESHLRGRAGLFCTLAASHTTMRGCPPPGALDTSWCPLLTPDTQPVCQTSATVPCWEPGLPFAERGSCPSYLSVSVCLGWNVLALTALRRSLESSTFALTPWTQGE